MNKNRIVWSSDGSGKNLAEETPQPAKYQTLVPQKITLKMRLEKQGRGGKTVTVIFNLPNHPPFFKDLLKKLKQHCGCGGTLKDEQMEIQGEHMEKIRAFLIKEGFQVKP